MSDRLTELRAEFRKGYDDEDWSLIGQAFGEALGLATHASVDAGALAEQVEYLRERVTILEEREAGLIDWVVADPVARSDRLRNALQRIGEVTTQSEVGQIVNMALLEEDT